MRLDRPFDRTFDEVSHSLFSRRAVRTQNVDQTVSLSRRPSPLGSDLPARITPSTFLFLLIRLSKNPAPSDTARRSPPRQLPTLHPIRSPECRLHPTPKPPLSGPVRSPERRISSPAAPPPSLVRFIRATSSPVNSNSEIPRRPPWRPLGRSEISLSPSMPSIVEKSSSRVVRTPPGRTGSASPATFAGGLSR
jgi:hypothetical protein